MDPVPALMRFPDVWRLHKALLVSYKIQLYGTYILPILLYGSETWTPNQRDIDRTNAFGQRCLRSICDIHWSEHKTNEYILKRTNQVPISCMIKKRRLKYLVMWLDFQMVPTPRMHSSPDYQSIGSVREAVHRTHGQAR